MPESLGSPVTGVTDGCESPDVDAGNLTGVLDKSSKFSLIAESPLQPVFNMTLCHL